MKLALIDDVTVNPQTLDTSRQATFGGIADGTSNVSLAESPVTDPFAITCSAAAGDDLTYSLGTLSSTQGISAVTSLQLDVGATASPVPDPPGLHLLRDADQGARREQREHHRER